MENIEKQYMKRKNRYEKLIIKQNQTINFISVLRFIAFMTAIGFIIYFYIIKKYYLIAVILLGFSVLFISLLNKYNKLIYNKKCSKLICEINNSSLKRLYGEWKSFEDDGTEFINRKHNYSNDLDMFGRGSLFQYINTANTYLGKLKLKETLTVPNYSVEEIYNRQEAIRELSKNTGWRQRLIAEGRIATEKKGNPELLLKWGTEKNDLFRNTMFVIMSRGLPIITMGIILVYFIVGNLSEYFPLVAIGIQVIILRLNSEERNKTLNLVYKYKKDIDAYNKMLSLIEKKKFKSKHLIKLKENLFNEGKITATDQINKLSKIVNLVSDRANFFYHLVNIITLWEFHCLIILESWKKESGVYMEQWLNTIAEIEALSSLSILNHNHPQWVIPEIKYEDSLLFLKGKSMGHPLMGKDCVRNSIEIGNIHSILLITGSNMSGKSTLLRTVGVNLVLAYSGAPVCAEEFSCSIMNIYTCMRISDNLEENISSFYAELLRIRQLIDAVNRGERVFFLLDEIFRGTNSKDRHTRAKVLIEKLSKENALGMVSTHDLELTDIEGTNKKIKNYYFREYYSNSKIYFDYKLRCGVSTTRNAIYLMRMAGIEIESNN